MDFLYYKIIIIDEFVQLSTAQIADATFKQKIPGLLAITTFTNHVEIMNLCRTDEERIFFLIDIPCHPEFLKEEELVSTCIKHGFLQWTKCLKTPPQIALIGF